MMSKYKQHDKEDGFNSNQTREFIGRRVDQTPLVNFAFELLVRKQVV